MKIKINILFWGDDPVRINNTKLAWYELNKFTQYAIDNGLEIEPFLFDLSEEQVLSEAIHIPYPKGSYRRSEKINSVIDYHGEFDGFFSIMDSDLFIGESDYDGMVYLLKKMKQNEFYVFKVNDLINTNGIDFDDKKIDYNLLEYNQRGFEPDLGGLFFIESKSIFYNRFDPFFTVWGGEDNDASYKLQASGNKKKLLPITPYHLPHSHALIDSDKEQYIKQVQYLNKK